MREILNNIIERIAHERIYNAFERGYVKGYDTGHTIGLSEGSATRQKAIEAKLDHHAPVDFSSLELRLGYDHARAVVDGTIAGDK